MAKKDWQYPPHIRLQRRGRPGIAPEFPVCRPLQRSGRPPTHCLIHQNIAKLSRLSTGRQKIFLVCPKGFPIQRLQPADFLPNNKEPRMEHGSNTDSSTVLVLGSAEKLGETVLRELLIYHEGHGAAEPQPKPRSCPSAPGSAGGRVVPMTHVQ